MTRVRHYERCLFIPFKVFDFSDPRVIFKYRHILEEFALTDQVRTDLQAISYTDLWEKMEAYKHEPSGQKSVPTADSGVKTETTKPFYAKLVVTNPWEFDESKATTEYIIPIANPRLYKVSGGKIIHPNKLLVGMMQMGKDLVINHQSFDWLSPPSSYAEDFEATILDIALAVDKKWDSSIEIRWDEEQKKSLGSYEFSGGDWTDHSKGHIGDYGSIRVTQRSSSMNLEFQGDVQLICVSSQTGHNQDPKDNANPKNGGVISNSGRHDLGSMPNDTIQYWFRCTPKGGPIYYELTFHIRNDHESYDCTLKLPSNWNTTNVSFSVDTLTDEEIQKHQLSEPAASGNISDRSTTVQATDKGFRLDGEAIRHLQAHAHYYSQTIWAWMTETDWLKAISNMTLNGKAIASALEPKAVAIKGNSVGFRWGFKDDSERLDWLLDYKLLDYDVREWMKAKGYDEMTQEAKEAYLDEHGEPEGDAGEHSTLVPMPTGGIFGEAVLGRSNAAEPLDLTRFWKWQDSPIPILPPEINPLTAGNKGAAEIFKGLKSSGLDPSNLTVQLPSVAPPPTATPAAASDSTASVMKALAAGNMFRDMSGAAQTASLAGQGFTAAQAGAQAAGEQNTEAMKINSEQQQAIFGQVADVVKSALPMLLAPETGGSSLMGEASGAGGAMNAAKKLDSKSGGSSNEEKVIKTILGALGSLVGEDRSGEKAKPEVGGEETV